MSSRRAVVILVVLAAVAAAWVASAGSARMKPTDRVLHVGDTVRVAGTATRCAVARRAGDVMIECLPVTPTAGSYATVAADDRVLVVRFRSPHVAQTVFRARHHRAAAICR
jgi:hypothetical protein